MVALTKEAVKALERDIKGGIIQLGDGAARHLISTYYDIQDLRVRSQARGRAGDKLGFPSEFMALVGGSLEELEERIKKVLAAYAKSTPYGSWALSIHGIGPVIAAGLVAYVDPKRFDTVGRVWKYFGLAPGQALRPGEKADFSPVARSIAFHIGENVIRNQASSPYGALYQARRAHEWRRNLAGELAEQALERFKRTKSPHEKLWTGGKVDLEYARAIANGEIPSSVAPKLAENGPSVPMLTPNHIRSRARRWVAKLVISHFWEVRYWYEHGIRPQYPWILAKGGHRDYIPPPNPPWDEAFRHET